MKRPLLTAAQHFEALPTALYNTIIAEMKRQHHKRSDYRLAMSSVYRFASKALVGSFNFARSKNGFDFWASEFTKMTKKEEQK